MYKIVIIGLGVITSGIIKNLKKHKYFDIFLYSKHCQSFEDVKIIKNLDDSKKIGSIDIILTCFSTGQESVDFLRKIKHIYKNNDELWIVDMTTSKPSLVIEGKKIIEDKLTHFVECPITGSRDGSSNGTLSLFLHVNSELNIPECLNPLI